jgi:hypothetical protein
MVGATWRKWPPIRRKRVAPYGRYLTAGGWGLAIVANFPPMIWFLAVSVILIRRHGIGRGVFVRAA